MECFKGEKNYFKLYMVGNREPVKALENWGDADIEIGMIEQADGAVLETLQFI